MLLLCQVVPSLLPQLVDKLLIAARKQVVGTTFNKAGEFIKLVASLLQACAATCQQAGTSSANKSCNKLVPKSLLQVCCKFVTSCAFKGTMCWLGVFPLSRFYPHAQLSGEYTCKNLWGIRLGKCIFSQINGDFKKRYARLPWFA